ncbi:septal ring lytic transglycosylase RlpA family protein [Flavobacterium sufflavum]|uniref:Septal ring lytic transglycosylase RlpA family protein n=1 Tax=Flavobacterium sufflavum TaxID=1921138 RepID=A0A437KZW7_9FLAO|nr:septal ring lytic transglycosylase RlpA family protein [Flavobacterium sufflavum]RVT78268.1 septal ring lytic transglycosylase RlpA family protein [Flavobacterium sufflavum]
MKKSITLLLLLSVVFVNAQSRVRQKTTSAKTVLSKSSVSKGNSSKDSLNKDNKAFAFVTKNEIVKDTIQDEVVGKLKVYKRSVHASYYADKFNGQRTTSGVRFSNNDYTAAHKKFPFGTKLKITNEANGKSVIVEVIDRGPFVRSREIDLTKRAFMEIAKNRGSGSMIVTIEEIVK